MSLLRKFLSKISPFTYFRKLRKWYGLQIDLYKEVKLLKMEQLKIKEQLKNSMLSGNSNPQKKK